ncbi:hypothetical protein AGMMS49525_14550 [Bacteroidia bacterium]|nr:hypothetical protein AGMMS49525_14550 [Bacteroidia bacterium]
MSGCTEEHYITPDDVAKRTEYKIAVVLPMSNAARKGIVNWAIENLNAAQSGTKGVRITAEWYDEETENMAALAQTLSARQDLCAIVGPLYSAHVAPFAAACTRVQKPILTPTASSEELIRAYSSSGYLWAMVEPDISQCEALLARAMARGAKSVAIVAKENDLYGQTFIDWIPFQAIELNIDYKATVAYTSATIVGDIAAAVASGAQAVICAPSGASDAAAMILASRAYEGQTHFFFSDVAYDNQVLQLLQEQGNNAEGIEGVAMGSDPMEGFDVAYQSRNNTSPQLGSSQLYDNVMLVGLAAIEHHNAGGKKSFNKAIQTVVSGTQAGGNWTVSGMRRNIDAINRGEYPVIKGASGALKFDATAFTTVLSSVYYHWEVYNGRFLLLDYSSSDPSRRISSTLSSWNWKATNGQIFDAVVRTYPPHRNTYALVVAASSGWNNYRHQADAFAMYQLLKKQGFDDSHIVLIAEDDIAYNSSNPEQGVVRTAVTGENLYSPTAVDYKPSQLTIADIEAILQGNQSDRLPEVIASDSLDNVLIYWVGHGLPTGLEWGNSDRLTPNNIRTLMDELSRQKHFRKLLFLLESCYSGTVGIACTGVPAMLTITAANDKETSKAFNYSSANQSWLSDAFSYSLVDELSDTPQTTYNSLYNTVYRATIGSHVSVYNFGQFDNLNTASIREFLEP